MQDDSGIKRVLSAPNIYEFFQRMIGVTHSRQWRATNLWCFQDGDKIIDIGCGPGVLAAYLPPRATLVGFDLSASYIARANAQFGDRATFVNGTTYSLWDDPRCRDTDVVTCNSMLHHLADAEALHVLEFAWRALKPGGRFVAFEACYLAHQDALSKWIMSTDRGQAIRQEAEWKQLVATVFPNYATSILTGLLRIPYVHICIECWKSDRPAPRPTSPIAVQTNLTDV